MSKVGIDFLCIVLPHTFKSSMKFKFCEHIQVYFGMLDALLATEELPEEYRDRCQVYFSLFPSALLFEFEKSIQKGVYLLSMNLLKPGHTFST